jgi:diacylglycerol kinase family enzyme
MRVALIANRAAGGAIDVAAIAQALRDHGAQPTVHALNGSAIEVAGSRPDRYVVAGGDGTIGPVARLAAAAGVPLAVVPTGTANDFARAMELPSDPWAAVALAADPDAGTREVELLRAGDRPFVNAASVGVSVPAARSARALKRSLGPLSYLVGAVRAGLTARPLRCRALVEGRELFDGRAWQVIVAGTGAFGGGARIDAADAGDRLIDVAVLEAGSRAVLARHALAMRSGALTERPGVRHARGREVVLDVSRGTCFNVDGELCRIEPARFSTRGERVGIVVRRGARSR